MSCIICNSVNVEEGGNYCGCENCGNCGTIFCVYDCLKNCVVCGQLGNEEYCGCENCQICHVPFCVGDCELTEINDSTEPQEDDQNDIFNN
jgi:hypothetical protein